MIIIHVHVYGPLVQSGMRIVVTAVNLQWGSVELTEAICRIYVSVNCAIIGSGDGLSPFRRQINIWTIARVSSIGHLEQVSMKYIIAIFMHETEFEYVVWKTTAILNRVLMFIDFHVH